MTYLRGRLAPLAFSHSSSCGFPPLISHKGTAASRQSRQKNPSAPVH
ncbi:MAG: hypothetical protein J7M32_06935 [Deltaproteobacteria bacterium]|nr:hypothetical protein [Deltaproteobacteria bacterium]